MELFPTSDISLRRLRPSSDDAVPRSEIVAGGRWTGTIVDGEVLETALKWKEFFLVFVTDDIPFEETLHIYLLNRQMEVIDSAHMYWMYCTGVFSNLQLVEPNLLRFEFFGGIIWTLELLDQPTFMLPFFSAPTGVHRRLTFHHHFRIHGKPLPQT